MKSTLVQLGLMAALIASLAGCGGGGGAGSTAPATGTVTSGPLASAAASDPAASNTANNPRAAFSLIVDAGLTPVTVNSPPVVNFAVIDSGGKHVPGLTLSGGDAACGGNNVKFGMAQLLDDGTWRSFISNKRAVAASVSSTGFATYGAFDPVPTAGIHNDETHPHLVGILSEHATEGYYTYQAATDVTDANFTLENAVAGVTVLTNGLAVAKGDNTRKYRAALQLCYVDPVAKATVKVNPYIDFNIAADGTANLSQDQGKLTDYRKVVDKDSCNDCHKTLAARHDDGLVDPNVCVICHNPGSTDYTNPHGAIYPNGNPIDLKFMVHRIHKGKDLKNDYKIGSFFVKQTTGATVTGVKFPQELRNCVKCHDSSKAKDAGNWKTNPSQNACWGCHDDRPKWNGIHVSFLCTGNPAGCDNLSSNVCGNCHSENAPVSPVSSVPVLPVFINHPAIPASIYGANFQYNIHAVTWNPDRTVSVEFSVSNPNPGGAVSYNVNDSRLSNLTLLFGWGSGDYTNAGAIDAASAPIPNGQPVSISAVGAAPVAGTSNHFRQTSTALPPTASGTGVVALTGSITNAGFSAPIPVQNAVSYFAIGGSGPVAPRRTVVSADDCNACHGKNLNMGNHVDVHKGNFTDPEVCVICHNGNSMLTAPVAGDTSAHFKRLIHIRHKALGEYFPAMPRQLKPTASSQGSYVGYTGIKKCTICHVDNSYQRNVGVMGTSTAIIDPADASQNLVISPKAAACSACHDSTTEKSHMINVGGAAFSTASAVPPNNLLGDQNVTQKQISEGKIVYEACEGCHALGSLAPVDVMHGLK